MDIAGYTVQSGHIQYNWRTSYNHRLYFCWILHVLEVLVLIPVVCILLSSDYYQMDIVRITVMKINKKAFYTTLKKWNCFLKYDCEQYNLTGLSFWSKTKRLHTMICVNKYVHCVNVNLSLLDFKEVYIHLSVLQFLCFMLISYNIYNWL